MAALAAIVMLDVMRHHRPKPVPYCLPAAGWCCVHRGQFIERQLVGLVLSGGEMLGTKKLYRVVCCLSVPAGDGPVDEKM